jgi:inorganic triphosphatase YgiF
MTRANREVEAKLAPFGPDARLVADRVAAATLDGFRLSSGGTVILHDRYFDSELCPITRRGTLATHGVVFRTREIQVGELYETVLTVKGIEPRVRGGAIERMEVERRWPSPEAGEVFEWLASCGVHLPRVAGRWMVDPDVPLVSTLEAVGLVVIQDRTTHRRRRVVQREPVGIDERPSLELAIDRVTYRFGDRYAVHYEVEVELLRPEAEADLERLVHALRITFPELQPISITKLEIGFALAGLADEGLLDRYVVSDELTTNALAVLSERVDAAARRGASPP